MSLALVLPIVRNTTLHQQIDFTFADGGAVMKFLRGKGLFRELHPSLSERILGMVAITWLPPLILSAFDGVALGGKVRVPFLLDAAQYGRFLVALPLAIWAEGFISPRLGKVLQRFLESGIVAGNEAASFHESITRATRLKDSVIVEFLIFAFAYLYVALGLERNLPETITSWNQSGLAHDWYEWVSMPMFLFVWIRWVWRQIVWGSLLSKIAGLKMHLLATHPDHAGGLTFVCIGQRRFAALVIAISTIASASIGEEMLLTGAPLRSFEPDLVAFFIVCVLFVMGPLLVFTPQMVRAKLGGWRHYGILAADYSHQFHEKWIVGKPLFFREELLGSQDIQALSDMMNSYEGVSKMRILLPDHQSVIVLLIAYALPLIPLLATVIPLKEILSTLLKLLA